MANSTSTIFLDTTPLTTSDASGLTATIISQALWQPSFVLRSDPSDLLPASGTALAAAGDHWRIMIAAPSAMPDFSFYPIALTASFVGLNVAFWNADALYTIVPPVGVAPLQHAWRSFSLDARREVFNGAVSANIQTAAPDFQGYPPSPVAAVETGISAIGGLSFVVGTFQAAEKADINLSVDARWLAFPRSAVRNAGFYMPRLFYKGN